MSGEVIRRRFWRGVDRTITHEPQGAPELVIKRVSLDALADQIRRESNAVVICQGELAKAEQRHEAAKQAFVDAVVDTDMELQAMRGRLP